MNNLIINEILTEWAYRIKGGAPDPKNNYHLIILSEAMNSLKLPKKFKVGLLNTLREESKKVYKSNWPNGKAPKGVKLHKGPKGGLYYFGNPETGEPDVDKIEKAKQDKEEPSTEKKTQSNGYTGDKDKSIKKINTSETETFSNDIEPGDDEFNNDLEIDPPPDKFEFPEELNNGKFPKKYAKLISRMMNSKRVGTKPEISTLISNGGAGAISAQAGEVLTLMATSMSDEEWETLQSAMLNHEKEIIDNNQDLKAPGKRVVNKSWILAAGKSRKAIRDRITKKYGDGVEISNTSWDTEEDVNAMGWDNYADQKGFSTDMYIKVKTKDGKEIMDEVSLKKDVNINFLNSSTGKFREWDGETDGTDIDSKVYAGNERENLNKAIEEFGLDLPEATSRNSAKAIWMAMVEKTDYNTKTGKMNLSDPPTKEELWIQSHVKQIRDYTTNATRAIVENPKLKAGMLEGIRKEFPLKSVGEGEETMAIGDLSLDPDTMKELFGTSDFEKIKENLVVNEDVDPPALAYRAGVDGEMFNVASIVIRQDGVGYGGSSMKFEMQMDKEFSNKLREAHNKVYG